MKTNDTLVDCAEEMDHKTVWGFARDDGSGGVFDMAVGLQVCSPKLGILPQRNLARESVQSVEQAGSHLPTGTELCFALWTRQGG